MNARWFPALILVTGLGLSVSLTTALHDIRVKYHQETISGLGDLPSPLLKAMALEFKGAASDYLFLKTMTFVGMKLIDRSELTASDWRRVATMLRGVTDLDGKFWDPYLFAEMMFPWQAGMLDEADSLLQKAEANLPNDFLPPYFLGFNAFYFEKNSAKAAPYLRRAAALPGAPGFLQGLAARVSLYGRQTGLGISFLEGLLHSTRNPGARSYLRERLQALVIIQKLEEAVQRYREAKHALPESLAELQAAGFIDRIPVDPYGGEFKILKNGRVYTTSDLVQKKAAPAEKGR